MPRILCDLPLFLSSSCSLKRTLSLQREDFSRRVLSAKRWHRFPDCFDSLRSRSSCKKKPKKKKSSLSYHKCLQVSRWLRNFALSHLHSFRHYFSLDKRVLVFCKNDSLARSHLYVIRLCKNDRMVCTCRAARPLFLSLSLFFSSFVHLSFFSAMYFSTRP